MCVCVCVDLVEFDKSVDAQKREDLPVAHVGEDLARRVEWNHTDHVGHKPLAAHVVANHVLPHGRDAYTVARALAVVGLLGQLSLASLRGRLISTSFGWVKGGNVTSAGWQVTLCDPMYDTIRYEMLF